MRKIGFVVNIDKPLAIEAARELVQWLEIRSFLPLLQPEAAARCGRPDLAATGGPGWREAELLIVLGGDGTLIRTMDLMAPTRVPVLGINTGHLGFLTELESNELSEALEPILAGEYEIEERLMLLARVERNGETLLELTALNDAVVSKGPKARLVNFEVSIGGTMVARYPADGVIVSTPTGSTAYSFSAGGPIVGPSVDVLLVTPICPHTMNSRAMVVAGGVEVTVMVVESPGEVGLSADGDDMIPLRAGDVVRVTRAPFTARLVRREGYCFYNVLRRKLANPGR